MNGLGIWSLNREKSNFSTYDHLKCFIKMPSHLLANSL